MSEADCGYTAGARPSGVGVILDSPHGSDASGEAFGQEKTRPDAIADLDLTVEGTRTAVLGPAIPVSDMVALATSHLRSPHSKRAYRQAVLEFGAWCTCTGTTTLNRGAVLGYVAELNRLRMSPATVNVVLCAIRRLASELRIIDQIARRLIRLLPTYSSEGHVAAELVEHVLMAPRFIDALANARPYLGVAIVRELPGNFDQQEFLSDYVTALMANPASVFYWEIEKSQNLAHAFPESNHFLHNLVRDAKVAQDLEIWRPVGEVRAARTGPSGRRSGRQPI